jgi:hypothetical protein
MITLDILNKHNNINTITKQTLHLLTVILKQNYFQYNNQFFKPEKGIAMGSPISSTIAPYHSIPGRKIYKVMAGM